MDKEDSVEGSDINVKSRFDESVTTIKKTIADAIVLERDGNWEKALQKLESIRKKVESVQTEASSSVHQSISVDDITNLKEELLEHIKLCNEKLSLYTEIMAPPSYEEAMSSNSSANSDCMDGSSSFGTSNTPNLSYSDLGALLENLKADMGAQSVELIYTCDNVILYFISNSERVTRSSGPDTARIFEIAEGGSTNLPKHYLQISTYVYPLVRQVSPCIRTDFGAILLPNINNNLSTDFDNQTIGLVIPKEYEEEFITILENILGVPITFCNTQKPEPASVKITNTIVAGAETVSNFLVESAQKAGQFMDGNTPRIIEKIHPNERHRPVAPCMKNGIKIARDVTAVTANVTGFVATKVGAATLSLGRFLAPHIRRSGSKILSQTTGINESQACAKVDTILNVTAGAVEGIGTIYNGLDTSARIFGRSLSNNTVQIVKHRYGHPAAEFTQDTFETVSNGIEIGTHIRLFKPKNLAKTTMKGALITESTNTTASKENMDTVPDCASVGSSSCQTNGSDSDSSLIDVKKDDKKYTESQQPENPVAFSSEILTPTVISTSNSVSGSAESVSTGITPSSEFRQGEVRDLLS